MAEKAGSRAVSLDKDSSEARSFADRLSAQLAREEGAIKETEFPLTGEFMSVWLLWSDGKFDKTPVDAVVDKFHRVHLPSRIFGNGKAKAIKSLSFLPLVEGLRKVVKVEPRFTGDVQDAVVLYVEGTSV